MLTLGAIAVVVMTLILLLLFHVRWRLLPLGVIVVGRHLGLRPGRLPRHPAVAGDHRRPARDAGHRHRLRDPDARARRGGGAHRRDAEHPIQETARNLCPALLVVTFDAVFAFAALRFAKVPMIRQFGLLLAVGIAVICLASIIVPLATLGIREYKSPTTRRDFREGLLGKLRGEARPPADVGRPGPRRRQLRRVLRRPRRRGQARAPDRPDPVGQPAARRPSRTSGRVEAQTGSSSELGIFVQHRRRVLHRTRSTSCSDQVAERQPRRPPRGPAHRRRAWSTTMDYLLDCAGRRPHRAAPRTSVKAAYDVAPDGQHPALDASTGPPANGAPT